MGGGIGDPVTSTQRSDSRATSRPTMYSWAMKYSLSRLPKSNTGTTLECTRLACTRASSMNWDTCSGERASSGFSRLTMKVRVNPCGPVGHRPVDLRLAAVGDLLHQPVAAERPPLQGRLGASTSAGAIASTAVPDTAGVSKVEDTGRRSVVVAVVIAVVVPAGSTAGCPVGVRENTWVVSVARRPAQQQHQPQDDGQPRRQPPQAGRHAPARRQRSRSPPGSPTGAGPAPARGEWRSSGPPGPASGPRRWPPPPPARAAPPRRRPRRRP